MAPPHSTSAGKPKPKLKQKKSKSLTTAAVKQPKDAPHKSAPKQSHQTHAAKPADNAGRRIKHDGDAASKVEKKRQRGHRGRLRGKAKTKEQRLERSKGVPKQKTQAANGRRTLLTLPKEIRHSIFTMTLKEDHVIQITKALKLPPLLSVCRQIRDEATVTWAKSNTFHIIVERFDIRLAAAGDRFTAEVLGYRPITDMFVNESHNWANLLHWARLVQQQRSLANPATSNNMTTGFAIANAAIGIAYSMIGKPWEECKPVLEKFRLALEALDGGWV